MTATLPPVFGPMAQELHYVQQVSPTHFRSECPRCGGVIHPDNEWPDRCQWFTDGKPRVWCSRCGFFQFADQLAGQSPPTSEDLERFRCEQIQREEERRRSAERALKLLTDNRVWEKYHAELERNASAREYWTRRGVPPVMQDLWQLGYHTDYTVMADHQAYHTPTATIPLFGLGWDARNIKHRLLKPPTPNDRYRYELIGAGQPLFVCDPDKPLDGHVYAVEGEIKAMVAYSALGSNDVRMVGLPGATPKAEELALLAGAETITLVMDPGAKEQGIRLARALGVKRCKLLIPPHKIDDMLLEIGASKREAWGLLEHDGVPLGAYLH